MKALSLGFEIVAKGSTFAYLVKSSTATMTNFNCPLVA